MSEQAPTDLRNPFVAAKHSIRLEGERLARERGVRFIWPRVFFVYRAWPTAQARSLVPTVIAKSRAREPLDLRTPDAAQDFVFVDDVASALVALMEEPAASADVFSDSGPLDARARCRTRDIQAGEDTYGAGVDEDIAASDRGAWADLADSRGDRMDAARRCARAFAAAWSCPRDHLAHAAQGQLRRRRHRSAVLLSRPRRSRLRGERGDRQVHLHHGEQEFDDLIRVSYSRPRWSRRWTRSSTTSFARRSSSSASIAAWTWSTWATSRSGRPASASAPRAPSPSASSTRSMRIAASTCRPSASRARPARSSPEQPKGYAVGKQDHYVAAYGGMNYMQFNGDESVFVEPLIFTAKAKKALERCLMLFYTGLTRMSSEVLEEQRASMSRTAEAHRQLVRVTHTLREHLRNNRHDVMGEILAEGWRLKSTLASKITTPEIDRWYETGIAAGATGGEARRCGRRRIPAVLLRGETGGGAGALSDLMCCPFGFEPQGSKIIYVAE